MTTTMKSQNKWNPPPNSSQHADQRYQCVPTLKMDNVAVALCNLPIKLWREIVVPVLGPRLDPFNIDTLIYLAFGQATGSISRYNSDMMAESNNPFSNFPDVRLYAPEVRMVARRYHGNPKVFLHPIIPSSG